MTEGEYKRLTLAMMKCRRWRTVRKVQNFYGTIPAGTEVRIEGKAGGLAIASPECKCCGVALYFRKVHPAAVEEIKGRT
jgi:hypothetical protein